jgi:predicted lipid carrier protein YhbT
MWLIVAYCNKYISENCVLTPILLTIDEMKDVLTKYFRKNISALNNEGIEYEFKRRIDKQVRDLLTDVQDFGY